MVFLLVLGAIAALVGLGMVIIGRVRDGTTEANLRPMGAALLVVGLLLAGLSTFRVVDPGRVGVPVLFGDVKKTLPAGFHVVNPFLDIVEMDVRTQETTFHGDSAIQAKSADGQNLVVDVTTQYHLDTGMAGDIYETVGENYFETLMLPSIREQVRNCAANYTAVRAFTVDRANLSDCALERVAGDVENRGLVVEDVKIRDVDPGETIRKAIERKLEAEQELQRKDFERQTAEKDAEIRRTEAQGIADAQEIIRSTLTNEYLQYEYIQRLKDLVDSPNNSTVILPFDQNLTPLLNVGGGTTVEDGGEQR